LNRSGSSVNQPCGLYLPGGQEFFKARPVVENSSAEISVGRAYTLLPPVLKHTTVYPELFLNLLGRDKLPALGSGVSAAFFFIGRNITQTVIYSRAYQFE
jgi:hypothetical protein